MDKKNMEIEALRGLAVIAVIISHIGNTIYWVPGLGESLAGYGLGAGVDLFFVISGFVITQAFYKPIREAAARGPAALWYEIRAFLLRRLFRVMPAALLWMMIICACSVWFNGTSIFGTLQSNFSDMIAIALNVSNFYFAKCITAGQHGWCGYNSVYWSVSLEEQFYLFFPLLVLLPRKLIVVATIAVMLWMANIDRGTMAWFTRIDGLLAGICLAFAFDTTRFQRIGALPLDRFRWASVLMLCAAIVLMPVLVLPILPRAYPEITTLCCVALIALAGFRKGFTFRAGWIRDGLAYIGSRSFALYLIHNPAAWMTREIAARLGHLDAHQIPTHTWLFTICVVGLLLFLSEISYRLVESPWREWGRRIAGIHQSRRPITFAPTAHEMPYVPAER